MLVESLVETLSDAVDDAHRCAEFSLLEGDDLTRLTILLEEVHRRAVELRYEAF